MREGVVVPVAEFTGEMRNGALLSSRYLFDSLRGTTNPGMDGRKKKKTKRHGRNMCLIYIETVMWHRDQAAAWGYHLHEEIPVRSCCGFGRRRAAFTGIIIGGLVGGHASEYRAYFFDFMYFLFFFLFHFF